MLDPSDYIDWDEGRDFPQDPFYCEDSFPCENCGKPCAEDQRTPVEDIGLCCSDCTWEASAIWYAEEVCPVLHEALIRAKSVNAARQVWAEHGFGCAKCLPPPMPIQPEESGEDLADWDRWEAA